MAWESAEGAGVPDLFIVGTLRKPAYWESTAVPELRSQAATAAEGVFAILLERFSRRKALEDLESSWAADPVGQGI